MPRGQKYSDDTIGLAITLWENRGRGISAKSVADLVAEETHGADEPCERQVQRWLRRWADGKWDRIRRLLGQAATEPIQIFEGQPPPADKQPQGVPPQETPALTGRTEAQSSVEKGDLPANEVTAQGSPYAEPRLKNAESFREAYIGALDRRFREVPNSEPQTRQQQSPDSLTLKVVAHHLSTSKDRFGDYHLDLTPNVEVNASFTIRVTTCVLIMGGGPISEYRGMPNEGKLLGKTTWLPSFRVPEWVQAGVHTVCIGALLAKTFAPSPFLVPIERLGVGGDKYVKSNEFEVTIPELPPPDAAMKAALAAVPPQHFASGIT